MKYFLFVIIVCWYGKGLSQEAVLHKVLDDQNHNCFENILWQTAPFQGDAKGLGAPAVAFIFLSYDSTANAARGVAQVSYSTLPNQAFVDFCDSLTYETLAAVPLEEGCKFREGKKMVLPLLIKDTADFWKGYGTALRTIRSAGTFYHYLQQDTSVQLLPLTYFADPKGRLNEASWGIHHR